MNDTWLMTRMFSDEVSPEEKEEVTKAIENARETGSDEIKDGDKHLIFAGAGDGKVAIEDQNTGEVTIADSDGNGNNILTNYDDEPDAAIEKDEDEDGNESFSLTYGPFESPEEAAAYDNSLQFGQYTFSDDEVASLEDKANELEGDYNKMLNNPSEDIADQVKSTAEYLKSYSIMAEVHGNHNMSDIIEMCQFYSDEADAVKDAIEDQKVSETPVKDYLKVATPEEIEDLDDDTKEAMQKALDKEEETGETATFSDVAYFLNQTDSPYNESVSKYFSSLDNDELYDMMAQFSDQEAQIIQNAVDLENAGYNVTFSDLNDALYYANTATITRLFSDEMTDEELADYEENSTPNQKDLRDKIMEAEADGENVSYSDACRILFFSDEEMDEVENNADEVAKAAQDLKDHPEDEELAKKVKVLADATSEDLDVADAAGYDTADSDKKVDYANRVANNVLSGKDPDDDDDDDNDTDVDVDVDSDDDDDDDDSVTLSHEESTSSVKNSITTPMGTVEFENGNPMKIESDGRGGDDDDEPELFSDTDTRSFSMGSIDLNTIAF